MRGYYFITDAGLSRSGNPSDVAQAVAGGAPIVQYRAKTLSARQMFSEAKVLRDLCHGARFIVNDRVDLALAVRADGVHLGQDDLPVPVARGLLGPDRIIGLTVHNAREAEEARRDGADYVAVSPIFSTQTKPDAGSPIGIELVALVKRASGLPVVAIGGITLENAPDVMRAGADCVCAISAVVGSLDVKRAVKRFQQLFTKS